MNIYLPILLIIIIFHFVIQFYSNTSMTPNWKKNIIFGLDNSMYLIAKYLDKNMTYKLLNLSGIIPNVL